MEFPAVLWSRSPRPGCAVRFERLGSGFCPGRPKLGAGEAGRIGDDREHLFAESLVRGPCQEGRVHAAGVCDQSPSHATELCIEKVAFGGKSGGKHPGILIRAG